MHNNSVLVLKSHEVSALLDGKERELIRIVRKAYEAHVEGESSLPHSTFLHFPDSQRERIIAMPAYLGHGFDVMGIKWISSFPKNLEKGLDRASAVMIMNSTVNGRPEAVVEGSIISAKRTAASAALAARSLHQDAPPESVGIVGCGLINFEIVRFLRAVFPDLMTLVVFDRDLAHAEHFKHRCEEAFGGMSVEIAEDVASVLRSSPLISLATTAGTPHIFDLSACRNGCTLLHISLRDLAPEIILRSDNVVDDVDHVCRADTSIHLAEQQLGHRGFIRCTLADITNGRMPARVDKDSITVFSPFGLGVLDMAVCQFVHKLAIDRGAGTLVNSFLPAPWTKNGNGTKPAAPAFTDNHRFSRSPLDEECMERYERDGYLFLPEFFEPHEVDVLVNELPAVFSEEGPHRILEKDGRYVRSVYGSYATNPVFGKLSRHPKLLALAKRILNSDVYVYQFKINAKLALVGDMWEWHQDYIFWQKEDGLPAPRVLSAVIFLHEVNEFNGPMFLIPGSHHEGVFDVAAHDDLPPAYADSPTWISNLTANLKYSLERETVEKLVAKYGIVAPKGPRGSVLLFHSNLAHASSPNLSPSDRPLAIISYNSVENIPISSKKPRPEFLVNRDYRPLTPFSDDAW
jgi:2,3-diaminopropionate biosynthesis protein SbnB